ncbi:hypothetical protein G6L37_31165 [Agrobacterium rubi]|uniref:hypothetical protein n=1 Tax=Agrobacterium rubi TaxID=28099 RepID=UPI001574478A|nr:hypothetical protein [Agrobacterium rubi]NTF10470.1 hypothetical protein [Agrobacterium rubi]NTF22864.1 hypothetical protein [Agrobacterium rubi]NTF29795.1 hypothetical protein [Agrobacterium rubi]
MRGSAIMFPLPGHVLRNLDQIVDRVNVSANIVAKLIVTREVTRIPAIPEEHDRQLANMHQFLRELSFRHEDFLLEANEPPAGAVLMDRLTVLMNTLDAIREASFVRPSTFINDLIRQHDE